MKQSTQQLLAQLKALSDPVRARIIALCGVAECSVSELTSITGQSQPRISQHLKQLCGVDLLERFKDGHFVYYRVAESAHNSRLQQRVLALLPNDEPQFAKDIGALRQLRADSRVVDAPISPSDRSLHRALVELSVSSPLGDLLDIGCGQGRILKLLASRSHRAVGVDIDSNARRRARAELLLAGTPNTTLRQGDMSAMPFDDHEFDTIILDDVLGATKKPVKALEEARRLLRPGGRIVFLASVGTGDVAGLTRQFAAWAAAADLRLSPPRAIPSKQSEWLLAVASATDSKRAAA